MGLMLFNYTPVFKCVSCSHFCSEIQFPSGLLLEQDTGVIPNLAGGAVFPLGGSRASRIRWETGAPVPFSIFSHLTPLSLELPRAGSSVFFLEHLSCKMNRKYNIESNFIYLHPLVLTLKVFIIKCR